MAAAASDDVLTEIFKRLPEKSLLRSKCVQKSWYRLIKSPHFVSVHSDYQKHEHGSIYMLVKLDGDNGYDDSDMVLYRIDPRHGLHYTSDSKHLHDLRPLLVFPYTSKEQGISCVKFGSKLYFFGLDYMFSLTDFYYSLYGPTRVHTIEEKDLMDIEPSENNFFSNFRPAFAKTKNPMHDCKYAPICFVANNKLYVLSRDRCTNTPFEVFCHVDETWQKLPSPYDVKEDFGFRSASHLVAEKEQMVYFSTGDAVMSFNLETCQWTIASTHANQRQPFFRQATLVGEIGFGFLDHIRIMSHVCTSKPLSRGEEVMQPYLAPDLDFLEVLRSSRFTYMSEVACTGFIAALQDSDNKEVVCFVTYGSKPTEDGKGFYTQSSYVALSFFHIPGDFYTSKARPVLAHVNDGSYANEEAEDGGVIRRYFKAKYLYTKHFLISNSDLYTQGDIVNCFI